MRLSLNAFLWEACNRIKYSRKLSKKMIRNDYLGDSTLVQSSLQPTKKILSKPSIQVYKHSEARKKKRLNTKADCQPSGTLENE